MKKWLSIAGLILLFVGFIGTQAAIFISANAGICPKSSSLLNSILWTCLYSAYLWNFLGKKKLYGLLIGFVIATILFQYAKALAGC